VPVLRTGNVLVRFGGGIILAFASAIATGLRVSIERRTGGSGGGGLFNCALFRRSMSSRRRGNSGRSSRRSLVERMCEGMNFFGGCSPTVGEPDGLVLSTME
jgi:hypothetical protein